MLKIGGIPVEFLVDTGATYSVLTKPLGEVSDQKLAVQGATGSLTCCWTMSWQVDLGCKIVRHTFLVRPECPCPLLGHDLHKMGAVLTFKSQPLRNSRGSQAALPHPLALTMTMPLDQEYHLGEFLSQEGPRNEQLLQDLMIEFPLVWSGKGFLG